jgi:hypothetical protein
MKKAVSDDLSYRLAVAAQALRESGCPRHLTVLAEVVSDARGKSWVAQNVESRINKNKIPVSEEWPETVWKQQFWYSLDPKNRNKPVPEFQPFILKWRG